MPKQLYFLAWLHCRPLKWYDPLMTHSRFQVVLYEMAKEQTAATEKANIFALIARPESQYVFFLFYLSRNPSYKVLMNS